MSDSFTFLLDAPELPVSEVQIAKLGSYQDARYGTFAITEDDVAAWARNLEKLPGGKALIDFDHLSDKPSPHRRTEAAGWLTGISLQDGVPTGTIEWTPLGRSAIEDGRYRFFSPAYGDYRDETGALHENVLTGGALSNKPFIGSMAQVTLASEDRVKQALRDDPESGGVAQAERDKAHEEGNSLPDKSYPVNNLRQLKAAIVLAQSGHGDVAAAKKLIIRRAKELGREDLLPEDWGDGKKKPDQEKPTSLDRPAVEVLADPDEFNRLTAAICTEKGLTFLDGVERFQDGIERFQPRDRVTTGKVLEAIGVDRKRAGALTTLLEHHSERVRTLETPPNAPRGERVDSERVLLAPDFDHGKMANPEERARRLAVARDHDLTGAYIGDKGAARFHAEDQAAVEAKWDLPRTLQRATEEREAKARAQAEAAKLQAPLDQTTALRQERLKLETEISELDRTIESEDNERAEFKRRGVWRAGLARHAGEQLAQRREKQILLDDLKQARAISLANNVPGFRLCLEQPVGWKKLLDSELAAAGPASPFDQEAIEAEHAEIHGRAQKYLLDHGLPKTRLLEALEAVQAGRDRAEPAGALSPKPPAQAARPAQDDWQRFDQEAKRLMLENQTDYVTALNIVMGEG